VEGESDSWDFGVGRMSTFLIRFCFAMYIQSIISLWLNPQICMSDFTELKEDYILGCVILTVLWLLLDL
jgi:hypothetical protein